ncbi:MAG: hypothetical protein AMXMBFR23_12550 [Chloroflexota bacterium]
MPPLPVVSGDEFIRAVGLLGYRVTRQRGSHVFLWCDGRTPLVVPRHRELATGTLRSLIRQAGLEVEAFLDLLARA